MSRGNARKTILKLLNTPQSSLRVTTITNVTSVGLIRNNNDEPTTSYADVTLTKVDTQTTSVCFPIWSMCISSTPKQTNPTFRTCRTVSRFVSPLWNKDHVYGFGTSRVLLFLINVFGKQAVTLLDERYATHDIIRALDRIFARTDFWSRRNRETDDIHAREDNVNDCVSNNLNIEDAERLLDIMRSKCRLEDKYNALRLFASRTESPNELKWILFTLLKRSQLRSVHLHKCNEDWIEPHAFIYSLTYRSISYDAFIARLIKLYRLSIVSNNETGSSSLRFDNDRNNTAGPCNCPSVVAIR